MTLINIPLSVGLFWRVIGPLQNLHLATYNMENMSIYLAKFETAIPTSERPTNSAMLLPIYKNRRRIYFTIVFQVSDHKRVEKHKP